MRVGSFEFIIFFCNFIQCDSPIAEAFLELSELDPYDKFFFSEMKKKKHTKKQTFVLPLNSLLQKKREDV